jgi:hypothetical protein
MGTVFDSNKLGTEKALEQTKRMANQFNTDRGSIVDSGDVATVHIREENATTASRLSEFTGFTFYTLGPVYTVARVGFDIVGEYGNHVGFTGPRIVLRLRTPLFDGLGPWNTVIEGIPNEHMPSLKRFMATQTGFTVDTGVYWRFEEDTITCLDPLGVDRMDIRGPDDTATIVVFVPSGNRTRYVVDTRSAPPIRFTTAPPRAAVVVEGRAAAQAHKFK